MPACLRWGGGGPRGSGDGNRIRQSESSVISAMVLYDTPRNAGSGSYVHAFPVISAGCSVHSVYGSQFTSVAAEVLK